MFKSRGKGGFKAGKGGSKGGKGGFGGKGFKKRSFGSKGFGEKPAMHSAVCDKCKRECEVPFKPSDDRQVFCSNCFKKPGEDRFEKKAYGRSTRGGESYGGDDGSRGGDGGSRGGDGGSSKVGSWNADQFKKQFDVLNYKLDKIINLLDPSESVGMFDEEDEEDDGEDGGVGAGK